MRTLDHLRVKDCAALLKHLLNRQNNHGVGPQVFAWKCFAEKQKGKGVVATPALISFDENDPRDNTPISPRHRPRPRPRRKDKGKKKHPVEDREDLFNDSGMETPSDVDWIFIDKQKGDKSSLDAQSSDDEDAGTPKAPPPRPGTRDDAREGQHDSEDEEDDEEAYPRRTATSGRRRLNKRAVLDSDDSDDDDLHSSRTRSSPPKETSGTVTTGPDTVPRTVKPVKRRRQEVDEADVIHEPRVRKESKRKLATAVTTVKAVKKPAARKLAARKPAASASKPIKKKI